MMEQLSNQLHTTNGMDAPATCLSAGEESGGACSVEVYGFVGWIASGCAFCECPSPLTSSAPSLPVPASAALLLICVRARRLVHPVGLHARSMAGGSRRDLLPCQVRASCAVGLARFHGLNTECGEDKRCREWALILPVWLILLVIYVYWVYERCAL